MTALLLSIVLVLVTHQTSSAPTTSSQDEFLEERMPPPPPGQRQRERFKVDLKFVQPLWGSTFQTNCNGEVPVNLRVAITADKSGLDVSEWNIYYKINGKFRESFPAHSSFASVALGPGRHVLKAELYDEWGDAVNVSHTSVVNVLTSLCYSGANPFGMPELAITSPIYDSIFVTGETGLATIPLRFSMAHADLRGGGFGVSILFDGVDMGVLRAEILLMREIGIGNHTIEARLVDSDDEALFVSATTKFAVVPRDYQPKQTGFDLERVIYTAEYDTESSLFLRARVSEEYVLQRRMMDAMGTVKPFCYFFVDVNAIRIALYDNGRWHFCDPDSCSDPFHLNLENNTATAGPTGMCKMYRVIAYDNAEVWPPNTDAVPPSFADLPNKATIVSAANSLKYMLKYWEVHLNKELYGRLLGHDYYVYIRGDEFVGDLGKRSPMFLKVLAINETLDLSPVVFFMDMDSWFDRGLLDRIPLEHYMRHNPGVGEEEWIFDEFLSGKTHQLAEINTAAFIIKDSPWTRDMLKKWWEYASDGAFSDRGLGDQILLQYLLVTNMTDMQMKGDPPSLEKCKLSLEICHADFHDWLENYYYPGLDLGFGHAKRFPHVYFHSHSHFPFFVCHHDFWYECHEQNSFVRHSGRGYFFNYTRFNGRKLLDEIAASIFKFGIPGLNIRANVHL